MLVLHPSSRCDICLDDYTWVTPANSPHAIPCGHIFCLICLRSLNPTTCPLCRKSYLVDRVKRLHVDRPPDEPDGTNQLLDMHANVLLQRVALVSGENAPDSDVAEVITDVMEWLETQSDDLSSNRPLRAAVEALRRYKAVQEKHARKKVALSQLRTQFANMQRNAEQDLKTSRTVEENLLAQLTEVQSHYTSKLEAAEAQINSLRNQMTRYKNVHNPLPPPPQPLPPDRFPSLGRHFAPESSTTPQATVTSATTNGHAPRPSTGIGRHGGASRNVGANGSAHTHAVIIPSSTATPPDQVQLASSTDSKKSTNDHRSRRVDEDRRMTGKGEGSNRSRQYSQTQDGTETNGRQSSQSSQRHTDPHNQYPYIQSDFLGTNGHSHAAQSAHVQIGQQTTNSRARIVPGAPPTHWVIPPPVHPLPGYLYRDVHTHAETDWESEGRPRDRYSRRHRHRDRRRGRDESSSPTRQDRDMPMTSASDGEADNIQNRLVSASAFVAGYGSGYDEGLGYTSSYSRGSHVPEVQSDYPVVRSDSSENAIGGLGLIGIPENIAVTGTVLHRSFDGPADMTTPRQRPPQSNRQNGTFTDWGAANHLTVPNGGSQERPRQTLEQVLQNDTVPSRDVRSRGANVEEVRQDTIGRRSINSVTSSVSSWGTVNTSVHGSMSDLGLIGLGPVTGQGSAAEDSQFIGIDIEEDGEAGTPRLGRADLPLGFVVGPRPTRPQDHSSDDERPRHLRTHSHPGLPAAVDVDHGRNNIRSDEQSIRPHYSRRHTLAQSVSLDSGTLPPAAYTSQTNGNALALTFDTSAPTSTSVPFTVNTRGDSSEYIRAPAPRVGGPNVLNLWRSGA